MGFEELNRNQLKILYSMFIEDRDKNHNGFAPIDVKEFFEKNKEKVINSKNVMSMCDGCAIESVIIDGIHRDEIGRPVMVCQAGLYA